MNAEQQQAIIVKPVQQKKNGGLLQIQDNRCHMVLQSKMIGMMSRVSSVNQLQTNNRGWANRQDNVNRTGLPDYLKNGVENLSGYSMDGVKVHYNSPKPAQMQAYAYAQGMDIHVAPGQEKYLPHEAWHVVQQIQGRVSPTVQMQGVDVNNNETLEREADVMGSKACCMDGHPVVPYHTGYYHMPAIIQGGWWSRLAPTIATVAGVGLATAAHFVPGMAPFVTPALALASGAVDVVKSGYAAGKIWANPRYEIPQGSNVTIKNCGGTVDGKNLDYNGNAITVNGKGVATLGISAGGKIEAAAMPVGEEAVNSVEQLGQLANAMEPEAGDHVVEAGDEVGAVGNQDYIRKEGGFDRFTRGLQPAFTAAGGLLGAVGGGLGIANAIKDPTGVTSKFKSSDLDRMSEASAAEYIAGNMGSFG